MKLKFLPLSIIPLPLLRKTSRIFQGLSNKLKKLLPYMDSNIKQAKLEINSEEYLAYCINSTFLSFIFFEVITYIILKSINTTAEKTFPPLLISLLVSASISAFIFLQQVNYPNLIKNRRVKDLETNLLHALRDILVQVSAGVPLFNVFVSIANGDYGEISKEFKTAVKKIGAGKPQIEALKELTANNPSIFFRRAMWQLANGMKAGSDVGQVLEEVIKSISEEQLVQIRSYGAQLNPIAMFYMLLTVIVPALSITFLIILASFLGLSAIFTKILFWSLYGVVTFMQMLFLGVIKAKRPSLMGE